LLAGEIVECTMSVPVAVDRDHERSLAQFRRAADSGSPSSSPNILLLLAIE
jgi:hypothetical protein